MVEKGRRETVQKSLTAFRHMLFCGEGSGLLGVRSQSGVNFPVKKLTGADRKAQLFFAESSLPIPMLGRIQAGWPSPEEEALCDIISLDDYLITRPESSFLLRVSGDSMTGAGILEGDLVIVEKGRVPKNGDVVIAEIDGEWTMKYFRKKGRDIILEAANPKYPMLRPQRELRIGGIVSAVIRKYHL